MDRSPECGPEVWECVKVVEMDPFEEGLGWESKRGKCLEKLIVGGWLSRSTEGGHLQGVSPVDADCWQGWQVAEM